MLKLNTRLCEFLWRFVHCVGYSLLTAILCTLCCMLHTPDCHTLCTMLYVKYLLPLNSVACTKCCKVLTAIPCWTVCYPCTQYPKLWSLHSLPCILLTSALCILHSSDHCNIKTMLYIKNIKVQSVHFTVALWCNSI